MKQFQVIICVLLILFCSEAIGDNVPGKSDFAPYLPFDPPSNNELSKSPKKVFAHYFPPFPLSMDNLDPAKDQWVKNIMNPAGFGKQYIKTGGKCRQRPLPRPVRAEKNWLLKDMELEVKRASDLGLDGFACDIVADAGINWLRVKTLLDAANKVDSSFKIMLMAGMPALFRESKKVKKDQSPERMAKILLELGKYPSAYRLPDNRLVVSAFRGNDKSPEWWKKVFKILKNHGENVAFVPLIQPWWDKEKKWKLEAEKFAPISYGLGTWGPRTAGEAKSWSKFPACVHQFTRICFFPVGAQDFRAKSGIFWEAANTLSYRSYWKAAIEGNADWVQIITWNDYSEGTEISPSSGTQYSLYDLTAYYLTWFKTGHQPAIKRDVIYYSHRIHSIHAKPDFTKQRKLFNPITSEPLRDEIELLCFLKASGTVSIEIGDKVYKRQVKAGLSEIRVPLQDGVPCFLLYRQGKEILKFSSKFPISSKSITYQDLLYRGGSSSRVK